jgi:hypothetical protein
MQQSTMATMGTCRLRGAGVGMAAGGRAQAVQNFAPVGSGAPQVEQWMLMEPHFLGRPSLLCTTAVTEGRAIFGHVNSLPIRKCPAGFASS